MCWFVVFLIEYIYIYIYIYIGCFTIAETKKWSLRSSLLTLFSFSFQIIAGK